MSFSWISSPVSQGAETCQLLQMSSDRLRGCSRCVGRLQKIKFDSVVGVHRLTCGRGHGYIGSQNPSLLFIKVYFASGPQSQPSCLAVLNAHHHHAIAPNLSLPGIRIIVV